MRRGNSALLKFFRDDDSHTGTSAAIMLRNVRPKQFKDGSVRVAHAEFFANFFMNVGGYRIRPRVKVLIDCQLTALQVALDRRKRIRERALAGAPLLT